MVEDRCEIFRNYDTIVTIVPSKEGDILQLKFQLYDISFFSVRLVARRFHIYCHRTVTLATIRRFIDCTDHVLCTI